MTRSSGPIITGIALAIYLGIIALAWVVLTASNALIGAVQLVQEPPWELRDAPSAVVLPEQALSPIQGAKTLG